MKKIIFITGGIRSGKSKYALKLTRQEKGKVAFIATAIPFNEEMTKRIRKHQHNRPPEWTLIEEPKEIAQVLTQSKDKYKAMVIDCIGLFLSNLLLDKLTDNEIEQKIKQLADTLATIDKTVVLVSNEVGSGLVPDNQLGRRFCDFLGMANQHIAKIADKVILMVSGIPIEIKSNKKTKNTPFKSPLTRGKRGKVD